MRLRRSLLPLGTLLLAAAPSSRAEYVCLRSGQRLHVTSYQLLDGRYRLQLAGGVVEVAADQVTSIDPEEMFASLPPAPAATSTIAEVVKAAASRYNVDAELINSVIAAESNFDPKAISRKNARGLMQLLPETAARFGVQNVFDPKENVDAGTHYLRDLLVRYNNDLVLALAAYNAGPEKVQQFGRVPPYAETISYVRRVKRGYEKSKSGAAAVISPKAPANSKTQLRSETLPVGALNPQKPLTPQ
jgi:soluble lytic murein transglycosylase-like protein